MASAPIQTVTIDRISNSGNAIAQQQHAGKTIHVPAGTVGDTLEVRLVDRGSHFTATLIDRTQEIQPRQPSIGPDTSEVGKDLLNPKRNKPHSFKIRSLPRGGKRRKPSGQKLRSWVSQRKM